MDSHIDQKHFEYLPKSTIMEALADTTRQYLVGNLQIPQALEFFKDDQIEIGIINYKGDEWAAPHYHTKITEYQYIISGESRYIDLTTKQEYKFLAGDFFVIHKHTAYIEKGIAGTRILFIKVPGINDKVLIESCPEIDNWKDNWDYPFNAEELNGFEVKPLFSSNREC